VAAADAAAAATAAARGVDVDWWRRPVKPAARTPAVHPVLARARVRHTVARGARAEALSVNPPRVAHQDALGVAVAAHVSAADADAVLDAALAYSPAAAVTALTVDAGVGAPAGGGDGGGGGGGGSSEPADDAAAAAADDAPLLRVNPAVVAEKKSRTVRNKEARRAAEARSAAARRAAAAETELLRGLPALVASADAVARRNAAVAGGVDGAVGRRTAAWRARLRRLGGRRLPRVEPLAADSVPLTEDLVAAGGGTRSLALPPVARGMHDAFVGLQARGLVEVQVPKAHLRNRFLAQ